MFPRGEVLPYVICLCVGGYYLVTCCYVKASLYLEVVVFKRKVFIIYIFISLPKKQYNSLFEKCSMPKAELPHK